jgi:hypothetical protein
MSVTLISISFTALLFALLLRLRDHIPSQLNLFEEKYNYEENSIQKLTSISYSYLPEFM